MHTRRVSAFLLGVWMGCSILIALVVLDNLRAPGAAISSPPAQAAELMKKLPAPELRLLLRYRAAEQSRRYLDLWEQAEIGLALALGACLFMATQRRAFPLVFCGLMLAVVIFQHFAVSPELAYRGRLADFPPGSTTLGTQARVWALDEVYAGAEAAKLLLGAVLAGYLFVFRTRQVRKKAGASAIGSYNEK